MKCICSFCEFFDSNDNILLCFTKYSLFKDISYRSICPFWTSLKPRLIKYFVRNTKYLLLISLIFVYAIQNLIIFITYYSSRFEKHLRSRCLFTWLWLDIWDTLSRIAERQWFVFFSISPLISMAVVRHLRYWSGFWHFSAKIQYLLWSQTSFFSCLKKNKIKYNDQ